MELESVFQKFSENRDSLLKIFNNAQGLFSALDLKSELAQLAKNFESLSRDSFKVLVIGEFKRGKSTFINALLGEEVLPAFSIPCTAVINEIKYAAEKRAVLHFASPLPAQMPELADDVKRHIANHQGEKEIPPMEIPVDRIEEFVVIPDPGKDQAESIAETPFSLVEIYWPIDLCKNRVEIIDSPGLNEHGTRTKVTTDYLSQVDAVIFVLSCSALASQSELQIINDTIIGSGHEEIFFVCNRFDEVRERDRQRLIDYGKKRLSDKTTLGDNGIHFLSALKALDAKVENNPAELSSSGFPELEKSLVSFLVNDRGKLKLLRPASALKRQINKVVREVIPLQKGMLQTDLLELEKRYEAEKPQLEEAERKRLVVRARIKNNCNNIREYVRKEVKAFMTSTARAVPCWLAEYTPEHKIKVASLENTKTQCSELTKELLSYVERRISTEQNQWAHDTLLPDVRNRIQEIYNNAQIDLASFLDTVDSIRDNLSPDGVTDDQRDVPPWERIVAAGAGWILWSPGSAIQGGQDGFKGLLKSLIPQFGAAFLLGFLGLTNPLIFIPALLGTGFLSAMSGNKKLTKTITEKVGQKIKDDLIASADENTEKMVAKISESLDEIVQQADNGMSAEIASIKANVQQILQVKQEGEENARKHEQILQEQQKQAASLLDALDEFSDSFYNIR